MIPTVSVCIPAYNSDPYILKTISSVLEQTYQDFEIIVVDDCSDDQTFELVQNIKDSRIRVFRNETRLGAEKNWNRTIEKASGRYLKLLCSDDYLYPRCLALQVSAISHPEQSSVALVCGRRDIVDERGNCIIHSRGFPLRGRVSSQLAVRKIIRSGTNPVGEPVAVLFRADLYQKVGPFSAEIPYVIDLDYWCRLLGHGDLYSLDETIGAFRIGSRSWSRKIGFRQYLQISKFLSQLPQQSFWDLGLGKFKAFLMCFLRVAAYTFLSGRSK